MSIETVSALLAREPYDLLSPESRPLKSLRRQRGRRVTPPPANYSLLQRVFTGRLDTREATAMTYAHPSFVGSPTDHATPSPRSMPAIAAISPSDRAKEKISAFSFIRSGFVLLGNTG